MNLQEASDTGDRLEVLVELRRQLAQAIDECSSGRDLAALSQRLMDVSEQVERVEASRQPPRSSARDEIAARRAAKATRPRRAARKAV